MKEGKDALYLRWENYGSRQPSNSASLRPVHKTDPGMPFLWNDLFHV